MKTRNTQKLTCLMLSIAFGLASLMTGAATPRSEPPPMAVLDDVLTLSNAADVQGLPAVAWNPGCDRFLVVWQDRRNGVDDDIWGRYVSGDGDAPASGEFNLTPNRAGNQRAPAVAYQPVFNQFIVVWMDDQAGNWDIYGQYFDCYKMPTSDLIAISTTPASQQYPDVACRYDIAWVVWHDFRKSNSDIYGQRLDPLGVLLGNNIPVSGARRWANRPQLAAITIKPDKPRDDLAGLISQQVSSCRKDRPACGAEVLDLFRDRGRVACEGEFLGVEGLDQQCPVSNVKQVPRIYVLCV